MSSVTVSFDEYMVFSTLVDSIEEGVYEIGDDVLQEADIEVPKDTTTLQHTGHLDPNRPAQKIAIRYQTPYAETVHQGFKGVQRVKAHSRLQTQSFGRAMPPKNVRVKKHKRVVDRDANPWMTRAMRLSRPNWPHIIKSNIETGLKGLEMSR